MRIASALTVLLAASCAGPGGSVARPKTFGLVIHGGAGTLLRENMTPETEAEYRAKLEEALKSGYALLAAGRSGLDAVEAAVRVMEDSPLFNAGKGAVFTAEGTNELDASIMYGKTLQAGAVAGVKRVKNPITLARAVMERSPHVMMAGEGAETFAKELGLELVDPVYFRTERRWNDLQRIKEEEKKQGGALLRDPARFGTVGAAALDQEGNLSAGASTGGMTNKRFGRIGDAPIIGAGTYADNRTCAISATGHGEYFIRGTVCHDISALMEYRGLSLEEAARIVVMEKLPAMYDRGGSGGIVAIDSAGRPSAVFNTPGMYRGWIGPDGIPHVAIFKD